MFESFWLSQKFAHDLSDPQTLRYRTDQTLCSYIQPPVSTSKKLASSPPKSVPFKKPLVYRQRSASHDPYDKADARDSFTELINLDLGPAEVAGSRKRKKTAKAMAMGEDGCETKTKGKKKTVTAPEKPKMSTPVATEQDGQCAGKDWLHAAGLAAGLGAAGDV